MNILFISNDPKIFKVDSEVRGRMRAYARVFGELHIISPAALGTEEVHEENLHLYPVFSSRLLRIWVLTRKAKKLIRGKNIEIVSAQDPFEHGLAALKAVEGTSAKLHIQVHTDFLSPWFTRSGNWRSPQVHMPFLNRMRIRWADRVLPHAQGIRVVSERVKASLIERYGERIAEPAVIPVSIDSALPPPGRLPAHRFTFVLMTIGRLEPEKRIEDILAALKLVTEHYPMAGLCIVGNGRERKRLEDTVHSLHLERNVLFLGDRSDARALLSQAHVYIQASAYEGYSRTLLEAALARVPIITTDVGIVGEVFKGYEEVLAVPVADPTALSLAIVGILEDSGVRQGLIVHAEAAAHAHLESVGDIQTRLKQDFEKTCAVPMQL